MQEIINIFIYLFFNLSKKLFYGGFSKWQYRAYVNDTSGANVSNATLSAYNSLENNEFNLTTNAFGFTESIEITDYVNNAGTVIYYSNYTIYAEKECYPSYRAYYNSSLIKNNLNHALTLGSLTYKNWDWDFAENCNITNQNFNVLNISSSGSGTWTLTNVSIAAANFDMNSSGDWEIVGYPVIRIIKA